jgi:hypothetical protein
MPLLPNMSGKREGAETEVDAQINRAAWRPIYIQGPFDVQD